MEDIKQFLGNGLYFDIYQSTWSFKNKLEEKLNVPQEIVLGFGIDHVLAVDKKIHPKILDKMDSEDVCLPKKCETEQDFYNIIVQYIVEDWMTPYKGQFIRPIKLEVDPKTVKLKVRDVAKVNSKKDGKYTLKLFDVKFKVKGTAEYGGTVTEDTPSEERQKLEDWAKEKRTT